MAEELIGIIGGTGLGDEFVNQIEPAVQLGGLKNSINRGAPFGESDWIIRTALRMNLESTLRPRGRPQKMYRTP
ncbi:MAG: hypothetical protein DRP65_06165 [Planctomycetota bacterium]|nr:MAG: hypothetical protein DRP65_06165 [Planctomycetota bacterium]